VGVHCIKQREGTGSLRSLGCFAETTAYIPPRCPSCLVTYLSFNLSTGSKSRSSRSTTRRDA